MTSKKVYLVFFKPILDKLVASLVLFVCFPLILLTSLVLAITNQGGVFFRQVRIGKAEKKFSMIKFKTVMGKGNGMRPDANTRLALTGALIRKLSIDELPQLINVLKGEMSLVGPRPLLVDYLPFYNETEKARHSVQPGITGWAQVHGRNSASWQDRMVYDIYYINNISFWLDLKILIMTVLQLFKFGQADFNTMDRETFIEYARKR